MSWVLILIVYGFANSPPVITSIDFASSDACHRAFDGINTYPLNHSGTCINKQTGEVSKRDKP